MSWTDDRVLLLRKLWGEGRTAAEIAKELGGVTRNAVIGKAHRLKLSNRVSPIQQNTKKPVARVVSERKIVDVSNDVSFVPPMVPKKVFKPALPEFRPERLYSLMDLKPRMCRWPMGDPQEESFGFCGCETVSGLPYCPDHARVAYQAATRARVLQAEPETPRPSYAEEEFFDKDVKQQAG
jgi:GcrA cell cycle regulator